jgi:hypothetical protein
MRGASSVTFTSSRNYRRLCRSSWRDSSSTTPITLHHRPLRCCLMDGQSTFGRARCLAHGRASSSGCTQGISTRSREIRDAAKTLWAASGEQSQRIYEDIRQPEDPPTFDEWIAIRDPLVPHKAAIDLMVAAMDNRDVGQHIIEMHWEVIEIAGTPRRFLASDRPLGMYLIKEPKGSITLPISPTKLFVAVNNQNYLSNFRRQKHRQIVDQINTDHIGRARRFVWAQSQSHSQDEFIRRYMSTKMEKPPFFPSLANYQSSVSS